MTLHAPRIVTLTLALFVALTGAAAGQSPQLVPSSAPATVRGRIVAEDTGKPLRRARVSFSSPVLGGPPRIINTNADGRYEVKDLPPGRYTVSAVRSGYLQLGYGQRRPLQPATPMEILGGQTIDRVDFSLTRAGFIAGRVTDEVGDVVAGAMVFAMRPEYWMGRRQLVPSGKLAISDDTGYYRVTGLAPGTYAVRATTQERWTVTRAGRKELLGFVPTYFPGTSDAEAAQRVSVSLGAQLSGLDFSLVPGRLVSVSGTAHDSQGRSLTNAMLAQSTLGPTGGATTMGGSSAVSAAGTFMIPDVGPGEYTLQAAGSGEVVRMPLIVADADIDHIALVASAGWSITGVISTESAAPPGLPRDRVRIAANTPSSLAGIRMQGEPIPRQNINDDWTFSMTGIVGPARFRVMLPDGWMVKSIWHDGRDVTDLAIEMKSREEMTGVQVIVTDRVTSVVGQLIDGRGAPISDATIIVFASDADKWGENSRFVRSVHADTQGQYQIKGLPAGQYLAVAVDYLEDGIWNDPEYLESIRRYGVSFTLTDVESRSIVLKLVTQ